MPDKLAMIKRIAAEHQGIKGHIKLVGDTVADQEALNALEQLRIDWIPGQLSIINERRNKLEQVINLLDEGLTNHFAFEEEVLPEILGNLFTDALILDHNEIRKEINEAKSLIVKDGLEGLNREDLLAREADIQQVINGICGLIEEHAGREEVILEMVQRTLKEQNED
ncbi:hemerythrin domain-containing protein [Chloroflexota bacterium]